MGKRRTGARKKRKAAEPIDGPGVSPYPDALPPSDPAEPTATPHPAAPRKPSRRRARPHQPHLSELQIGGIVALLLLTHFLLAVSSVRSKSPTYDEVFHLTRGYTYWITNDFRLSPPHSVFPQLWAGAPLFRTPAKLPPFNRDSWYRSNVFAYGPQFFYGMGNDLDRMLFYGRAKIALLSVALGLVVFLLSRRLFGTAGGLLSLVLYTFSPSMLAHARLVTTDLSAAMFFLFALGGAWWCLEKVTPARILLSGLAFAGLFLSKMTAFLSLPSLFLMMGIRLLDNVPLRVDLRGHRFQAVTRLQRLAVMGGVLAAYFVIVYGSIWAAYGFRYRTFRHAVSGREQLLMPHHGNSGLDPWEVQYRDNEKVKTVVEFCRGYRLFPEPYLYAIALGSQVSRYRAAFLDGRHAKRGFPDFFPRCFLYKTSPALVAALLCALLAGCLHWHTAAVASNDYRTGLRRELLRALYVTAPLWLLLLGYWAVVIRSHLNIGHRHILPSYPPLFVLAGGAAGLVRSRWRLLRVVPALCAAGMLVSSLSVYPHYLSYFNLTSGGPSNGFRHLVDSSLDWGQDLIALRRWLRRNGGDEQLFISYFGNAPPEFYGVRGQHLPFRTMAMRDCIRIGAGRLTAGIYCVSATNLQQVYAPTLGRFWSEELEQDYRQLEPLMREFEDVPLEDKKMLLERVQAKGDGFEGLFRRFQVLRFGKLCEYLRDREPDARAGYSIHIYRLTEADLREALDAPFPQ